MSRQVAMLSRAAEGLYWMSRYMERAENIARMLDAGRRMNTLPSTAEQRASEWASIVIASGSRETFPHPLETATKAQVADHLIFDEDNASSIKNCIRQARSNARAMRTVITSDVWDVINLAWSELRAMSPDRATGSGLVDFLDWTKFQGFRYAGAVEQTILRAEGFCFIRIAKLLERADATARLLDVKHNVLLPSGTEQRGALDHGQWVQLLRVAGGLRAYRWVYRAPVEAERVVHFFVVHPRTPRSLASCYERMLTQLDRLADLTGQRHSSHDMARDTAQMLTALGDTPPTGEALHEFLTDFIRRNNALTTEIASNYAFAPVIEPADTADEDAPQQSQSQR